MADEIRVVLPVNNQVDDKIQISSQTARLTISQIDGNYFFRSYLAPVEVSYTGWGLNWSEVPRDGKVPYLVMESQILPRLSFTMLVVDPMFPDRSIEGDLIVLKRMATSQIPVKLTYGGKFESAFSWRITNFDFTSQRRSDRDEITQAEVSMEFAIARDVKLTTGPLSGGASKGKPKKPAPKSKAKPKGTSTKTKVYVVKRGDTLVKISMKLFKTTSKWRWLGDKNGIKNPNKLRVGQRLKY